MGKNNKDIESIDLMLSILDRVNNVLNLVKDGKTSIKEACRLNDISYSVFRRVVFSTDWEEKDSKRGDLKKKFMETIPVYHWTEILFCDIFALPRVPSSIEKMPPDVRETMENALTTLTDREQKVIRCIYEENMTKEEIAEVIERSPERVRQIRAKAMRKLSNPSRHGYMVFGDGYYCKRKEAYAEVYENSIAEAKQREIDRLDAIILQKKNVIRTMNSSTKVCPFKGDDEITVLNLSVRSFNCLWRAGIQTIDKLQSVTEDELLHVRNLGKKSFDEIVSVMDQYGLKLTEPAE